MFRWLKKIFFPDRVVCYLSLSVADVLLKKDSRWRIAKEEDRNTDPSMVYLERDD